MKPHSNNIHASDDPLSNRDIYEFVKDIAIEEIVDMTDNMIVSIDTFDCWFLSAKDGNRLVKILNSKKRIIKSSFTFQLKKIFSDFKSIPKTRLDQNLDRDRYSLKLAGVDPDTERQELESIINGFEDIYSDAYYSLFQRLKHCTQRSQVSSRENPLHVRRLYEALRYSLDSLNLESKYQIALYRLFAASVINELTTTYEKIDSILLANNILPELLSMKQQQESCQSVPEAELDIPVISESPNFRALIIEYCDGKETKGSVSKAMSQQLVESGLVLPLELVEYLDSLFSSIFNEEHLPKIIKQQLGRLQSHLFLYAIENGSISDHPLDSTVKKLKLIAEREVSPIPTKHRPGT